MILCLSRIKCVYFLNPTETDLYTHGKAFIRQYFSEQPKTNRNKSNCVDKIE